MNTIRPWFEYLEHRYQQEIDALDNSGFNYRVDTSGELLIIEVDYSYGETVYELTATFPPTYPYFPFSLRSPNIPIGRHLGAQAHDLCVLADIQNQWDSANDTLAGIIASQIPLILSDHKVDSDAKLHANEAFRPSGFTIYSSDTRVFVGDWEIPEGATRGDLVLGLDNELPLLTPLRGAVIKCSDQSGQLIGQMDYGALNQFYEAKGNKRRQLQAKWVSLPSAPVTTEEALAKVGVLFPDLKEPRLNKGPDIVGIAFPEEDSIKGGVITNWMFLVRVRIPDPTSPKAGSRIVAYLARAQYLTPDIMRVRSPRTAPLSEKKVLLVGIGALGSPLALQLARAGVGELRLMDPDQLETGNLTRWLPALGYTGCAKTFAAAQLLATSYPYTKVYEVSGLKADGQIGRPRIGAIDPGEHALFVNALNGIDLVIDATAERAVNHFISDFTKMNGIPYLWATATPGGWGGVVGRVIPGSTEGCWQCSKWFFNEEENTEGLKLPPAEKEDKSKIQPKGCFHPTFTGSGFDLEQVSIMAARLAIATLCRGHEGGYPDFDWDVAVLSAWDEKENKPTLPQWTPSQLPRHPKCGNHE